MKFMTLRTSFFALAAALIAAQAPVGMLHAEATHPFFSVEGDGRGAENVLKEYTEKEFLEFVPRQAPRGGKRARQRASPRRAWQSGTGTPTAPMKSGAARSPIQTLNFHRRWREWRC